MSPVAIDSLYVVTHPDQFPCPQHPHTPTRWHIPDNGIGVVCEACGAWCLVRLFALAEEETLSNV